MVANTPGDLDRVGRGIMSQRRSGWLTMSEISCLWSLACLWPSNPSLKSMVLVTHILGKLVNNIWSLCQPSPKQATGLIVDDCTERWMRARDVAKLGSCPCGMGRAASGDGSRTQGPSSNLRIKQWGWSGSDVWMHIQVLVWLEGSMQLLIPYCISGLWSCVTWGQGDLQSSWRSGRDWAPWPSAGLRAPTPKHRHTQLPISSLCKLKLMVSVGNLFHSCVCRACGRLVVIPVQMTVDKNGLLGLNTNLLHYLLILHWYFCQASGVRSFVSISKVFLVKICKWIEVER